MDTPPQYYFLYFPSTIFFLTIFVSAHGEAPHLKLLCTDLVLPWLCHLISLHLASCT